MSESTKKNWNEEKEKFKVLYIFLNKKQKKTIQTIINKSLTKIKVVYLLSAYNFPIPLMYMIIELGKKRVKEVVESCEKELKSEW